MSRWGGIGVPVAIMIFNKRRKACAEAQRERDKHVLFIDASREYDEGTKRNHLRGEEIAKIAAALEDFAPVERYSRKAALEEIREANFNQNIPRWVDTFEEAERINIPSTLADLSVIEVERVKMQAQMADYQKEFGIDQGLLQ